VERIAQCQCGSLRVIATGEPDLVGACHCVDCQRRTGAVFGSGAFYNKSQVRIEGPSQLYTRDGKKAGNSGLIFVRIAAPRSIGISTACTPLWHSGRHLCRPCVSLTVGFGLGTLDAFLGFSAPGAEHFQQLRPT